MPVRIALLRGVNMGGHRKLAMSDLRAAAEKLGWQSAQTLLQSGNLIFTAEGKPAELERQLEAALLSRLKVTTQVMVRSAAEWKRLVADNPYPDEAARDPSHLALMLLKDKPPAAAVAALRKAISGGEYFETKGRALYAFYPDGFAATKFTTALIDRTLQTVVTGRNWNTVLKIGNGAA